jgi:hypothetical protein
MTFKTFKKIASKYRPDVRVSRHGDYCNNRSKNTLGIVFVKADGSESRVYDYHGTYAEILNKLNIKVVTVSDIASLKAEIVCYKNLNGQESIFDDDDTVSDFSKEIADLEARVKYFETSDDVVREWEY